MISHCRYDPPQAASLATRDRRAARRVTLSGVAGTGRYDKRAHGGYTADRQVSAMPTHQDQSRRRQELYALLGELPDRHRPVTAQRIAETRTASYVLERLVLDLNGIEPVPAYFARPLTAAPGERRPTVALGMQLLLSKSEEQGDYEGLNIIPGKVVRFSGPKMDGLKVPHMGWNSIKRTSDCPIFAGVTDGSAVFFVHSYYVVPPSDAVAATTDYGVEFCSVIWKDNVIATQFHPEKSGSVGLIMLKNFTALPSGD